MSKAKCAWPTQSRSASAGVMHVKTIFSLAALVLVAISQLGFSQTSSQPERSVWYWSGDCQGGRSMGLEVLLDGKSIYHMEFRPCLMDRNAKNSESESRIRVFSFVSTGQTFQGTYHTRKGERIEGNVWQAGADPDDLLLGLAFSTKHQILLNTIHIAKPDQTSRSQIDTDLVVRTYPLRPKAN